MPSLRHPRSALVLALAVATGMATTCTLAGAALAQDAPPALTVGPVVRAPAVAAILLDVEGRPTYVEVTAPTVEQAVQRAARMPGSDGVAVDSPMTAMSSDPFRSQQWSLDVLKVGSLPTPTDRASHLVAVVDSGVRATHEDFAAGQVRCDLGADFTGEGLGPCVDRVGHGTHVAGIVGAVAGNGKGVASLAPGTSILPVRVLDSTGSGGSIAVARGIVHAVDRGAKVINLSLGGPDGSSELDAAVRYATDQGALVVVSAGNNRTKGNQVNYPAASPGALSVASTDRGGASSSFSYSGPSVDLAAPGGGITGLWATSDQAYATASGTSMAAPAVSAAASLYRAAYPSASPAQVTAALLATATDLETSGRDDNTGAGLVNPLALLAADPAAPPPAPAPVVPTPVVPAPVVPAPVVPAPVVPAPVAPAPVVSAPVAPAPVAPAPIAPVPIAPVPVISAPVAPPVPQPPVVTSPAPVVTVPTKPAPAVAKAPTPGAHLLTPRVARRQAVSLALRNYRPASTVTVLESWTVTAKVRVKVGGRTTTQTRTTSRSKQLGTFRVPANGSVDAKVLPVQGVSSGTLVVRGLDRSGKAVQTSAPLRVG